MYNNKENKLKLLKLIKNKVDRIYRFNKLFWEESVGLTYKDRYKLEIDDKEYFLELLDELSDEKFITYRLFTEKVIEAHKNNGTLYPIMIKVNNDFYKLYNRLIKDKNNQIINIKVVSPEAGDGMYKVVINDDYNNPLEVDNGKYWKLFLDMANKSDVVLFKGHKGFYDYFNSNKANPLYSKRGYPLTKILKKDKEYIRANIKIGSISEKAFQTRKNSSSDA